MLSYLDDIVEYLFVNGLIDAVGLGLRHFGTKLVEPLTHDALQLKLAGVGKLGKGEVLGRR